MEQFVASLSKFEWNRSLFFKLFVILWIGVSLDITVVNCTPTLAHSSRASYLAPIGETNSYPQRFRSIISALSAQDNDDLSKQEEDISKSNDSDDDIDDRETLIQDLSRLLPTNYRRIGVSKRRPPPIGQPRRVMSKKALSLFAHWKPSHYTSNEDSSLASNVISAVARGQRPMGGPLRWGRR